MSSNISQNYPYTTETEDQRITAVEKALETFDGLRDKVSAETTPYVSPVPDHGAVPRSWVWVCPKDATTARLHIAGFARDLHAVYTVCDTHGDTYLR